MEAAITPRPRGRPAKMERAITPRQREPRAVEHSAERRRRRRGTLDRMAQYKLDVFDTEQLDPAYIYRWVSDEGSRLRISTRRDDYDFVLADEIPDFSPDDLTDSEPGNGRIRMISGELKNGKPLYQYLLKKPRNFWEEDNAEAMDYRDDMLAGRVMGGDVKNIEIASPQGEKVKTQSVGGLNEREFYVPPEAELESGLTAGGSRRGPVSPKA